MADGMALKIKVSVPRLDDMEDEIRELIREHCLDTLAEYSPYDNDYPGHNRIGYVGHIRDNWNVSKETKRTITFGNRTQQAGFLSKGTGLWGPSHTYIRPNEDNKSGYMKFRWRYEGYRWIKAFRTRGINPRAIGKGVHYDFDKNNHTAILVGINRAVEEMAERLSE